MKVNIIGYDTKLAEEFNLFKFNADEWNLISYGLQDNFCSASMKFRRN